MEDSQAASLVQEVLAAINTSAQRDELLACLAFIGQSHQNIPDLLSAQTLASFPAWLDGQGFSSCHLGMFFHDVDRIVTPLRPAETLCQIYSSLGIDSSVLQLVDAVAERSPIVYEVLIQSIEQACQTIHEIGTVGGGMSTKGKIEVGVGAVAVSFGIGLLLKRLTNGGGNRPQPDARAGALERVQEVLGDYDREQYRQDLVGGFVEAQDTASRDEQQAKDAAEKEKQRLIDEPVQEYRNSLREASALKKANIDDAQKASEDLNSGLQFIDHRVINRELSRGENAIGNVFASSLIQSEEARVETNAKTEAIIKAEGFEGDLLADGDKKGQELLENEVGKAENNIEDNIGVIAKRLAD